MSDAVSPRRAPWPTIAFAVVLAQLLAWNVWVIVRNQRAYGPHEGPHVVPRDISRLTQFHPWDQVWATYGWYYLIRKLGTGTTLVVTPEMEGHRFYVEELSRLHLEVDRSPLVVTPAFIERIKPDEIGMLDEHRPCRIVIEPGATRYRVVRTHDYALYLVLPEARYQRERAAFQAEIARNPELALEVVRWGIPDSLPFYWYGRMRQLGAGTTVVVPPEMTGHRTYLERMARLKVEIGDSVTVEPAFVARFHPDEEAMLDLKRTCKMVIEPGATRYVVVHTPDFLTYLVVPEARYRDEVAAARGTNVTPK
jgi:hypothetical protein